MKHLRKSRIIPLMLALLIMAGYAGFGLSEHICYSNNERIISFNYKAPACNHQDAEPCCQEYDDSHCELDQACCTIPASEIPPAGMALLDAVCCVDGFKYHSLREEVVLTSPSLKVINTGLVLMHHTTFKPDIAVLEKEQPIYHYKSPPAPQLKTLLLLHQLRLDPDLA